MQLFAPMSPVKDQSVSVVSSAFLVIRATYAMLDKNKNGNVTLDSMKHFKIGKDAYGDNLKEKFKDDGRITLPDLVDQFVEWCFLDDETVDDGDDAGASGVGGAAKDSSEVFPDDAAAEKRTSATADLIITKKAPPPKYLLVKVFRFFHPVANITTFELDPLLERFVEGIRGDLDDPFTLFHKFDVDGSEKLEFTEFQE